MIGESGVGKSALLKQGLSQTPGPALLLVYLERWGDDWVAGPRKALALALAEAGIRDRVAAEDVFALVERLQAEQGKLPVLVLDQFDDYYALHRARFVRGEDRHVLQPDELLQENPFWRDLARLLAAEKVSCLFAVRADAQLALAAVRFPGLKADLYPLDPLDRVFAAQVLERLSEEAGLLDAEAGFHQLRDRLLADLGPEGFVLPAQMKLAFRGLATLDPLTVEHYIQVGGLRGLEALSVEHEIARAARIAGYDLTELRPLLLALVDPRSKTTKALAERELLALLPEAKRDPARMALALERLRDSDIVRQTVDPDRDEPVWRLDHDYLCLSLIEIERRGRRWQVLLAAAADGFGVARGAIGRWRALLRPTTQLRLLYERLRGRLAYGTAGGFAALSISRLVLNPVLLSLVLVLFAWNLRPNRETVADYHEDLKKWGLPGDLFARYLSGSAACWGDNRKREASPVPGGMFYQVSAGGAHSCGLRSDHSIVCWGDDEFGQVSRVPRGSYSQVNAGGSHSCGLRQDRSIVCWGDNRFGQAAPVPPGPFSQVDAGSVHSCGVKADGSIACWGDNRNGQVAPVPPGTYTQVATAISTAGHHSCGLRTDGSIVCWGDNRYGQVSPVPPGTYSRVSAAENHTCGLRTNGLVVCWGDNASHQVSPIPPGNYAHVSTGKSHTCGVKSDGSIACWGGNGYQQAWPVPPGTYFHVAAGSNHSCALEWSGQR